MNEARLLDLLSEARALLARETPEREPAAPECLGFARAHALALNPARWLAAERDHVARCHRCRRLVASFVRQLPRLSFWSFLRRRLGGLAMEEQRAFTYHLEEGEYQLCRARDEQLAAALPR